jgi:hypothetical protein
LSISLSSCFFRAETMNRFHPPQVDRWPAAAR